MVLYDVVILKLCFFIFLFQCGTLYSSMMLNIALYIYITSIKYGRIYNSNFYFLLDTNYYTFFFLLYSISIRKAQST